MRSRRLNLARRPPVPSSFPPVIPAKAGIQNLGAGPRAQSPDLRRLPPWMPAFERVKKSFVPGTSRNRTGIGPRSFREHLRCVGDFFTRSFAGMTTLAVIGER